MSVPYPTTSSGPRDAYNYYQSQVRINIECAFGVLTNRWCLPFDSIKLNSSSIQALSSVLIESSSSFQC